MKTISDFTNLYQIQKTLRFELKPIGKTLKNIENKKLILEDEERARSYKKVKKILDEYHKWFIAKALENVSLKGLDEYYFNYNLPRKEEHEKETFEKCQANLRKQIVEAFHNESEIFAKLRGKELFKDTKDGKALLKKIIPGLTDDFLTDLELESPEEAGKLIDEFSEFTTYFSGFHENRKNMYSPEPQPTAIAYRLIHENLPRFVDNMKVFDAIMASVLHNKLPEIHKNLDEVIQVNSISEMFRISYFSETLTQQGIDVYNHLIGGYTGEGDKKIQGLNEYINLYNQQIGKDSGEKRIPKLKILYKQILSDRQTASFIPEQFEDDNQVFKSIEAIHQKLRDMVFEPHTMAGLKELLQGLARPGRYDLNKIYLRNDLGLTDISQKWYRSWSIIEQAWNAYFDTHYKGRKKVGAEDYMEDRKKEFKRQGSFSIGELNSYLASLDTDEKLPALESYFAALGQTDEQLSDLFTLIETAYNDLKEFLVFWDAGKNLLQQKREVEKIKAYLDRLKELQRFVKPLLGNGEEPEKDEFFYGDFIAQWDALDEVTPLYNKVRNYLTRKPYSTEKFKLNFQNPVLLEGWPVTKEIPNSCIILRDENYYYLGILDKKEKAKLKFDEITSCNDYYLKMYYLQAADPGKDVQNFMVIDGVTVKKNGRKDSDGVNRILEDLKNEHLPSEINRIRKNRSYSKQSETFNKEDLIKFIDYYKERAKEYYRSYIFMFKDSSQYKDFSEFTDHINEQAYQINFSKISKEYIDMAVEQGRIYLFQIYNKDFSPYSKGTPNMHTLYWKMLFDERNIADVVYKLNGQAEVFYRRSSIQAETKVVHRGNSAIANKNALNRKKESIFNYDIVKDKRFTVDKFQFHVPLTLNFKAEGLNNINEKVARFLKDNVETHIIGIDRGERHLLYLTVIDGEGKIKEQYSLNEIVNHYKGNTYTTNYHQLLDQREAGRDKARKDWDSIETIKELKEGYISQVVHKIAQLMVQYNAIVTLEDLNHGFMRGRQKVEKQVYQKFEKMLIDKLNYLVDKKKPATETGGVLKALQLTNNKSFGKQNGFLFYVPAWNTSKIDPVTGFVNMLDTRYTSKEAAQKFFGRFRRIAYCADKKHFVFSFDYNDFHRRAEGTKTEWDVIADNQTRYSYNPSLNNGHGGQEAYKVAERLEKLFNEYGIHYEAGTDLREVICNQDSRDFYKRLLKILSVTLSLRHNNGEHGEKEEDYILSPVAAKDGLHYDSRREKGKGTDSEGRWLSSLPVDADANGAYNIARKGLCIVKRIREANDLKKPDLFVANKQWLQFAQKSETE